MARAGEASGVRVERQVRQPLGVDHRVVQTIRSEQLGAEDGGEGGGVDR